MATLGSAVQAHLPELSATAVEAALIQSNYSNPGNLEAVVRMRPPVLLGGGDFLAHFWYDATAKRWNGPYPIEADGAEITGVT